MDSVRVEVVPEGESRVDPEACRGTVVGPGVNQPEPHPGYGGFVGWESPLRLRDGTWLVAFSAGYWHASPPTPLRYPPETLSSYRDMGMPQIEAPTGGRAMITRSVDQGRTWSRPTTLIDTPADDRHPSLLELPDGSLLCSFFAYASGDPEADCRVCVVRSLDAGRSWETTPRHLPSPFVCEETDGPMVLMPDGSVLMTTDGRLAEETRFRAAVYRSADGGETWDLLSTVAADHDLVETTIARLPDGRLVMVARAEGDICWSEDDGRTWTPPVTFGMRLYAPGLRVLQDGTLVCLHGSYAPGAGGLRVIFSRDGGRTWVAPAVNHGFLVDRSYGYGKAMELTDGSLFAVYLSTGGHRTQDAQTNAIHCIRLRVRPDHRGIDLLPGPNR
jgi:hypothetical protein